MKYDTIKDAAYAYVSEMNAIPYEVVKKLLECSHFCDLYEVTPPTDGDRVYLNEPSEETGERNQRYAQRSFCRR